MKAQLSFFCATIALAVWSQCVAAADVPPLDAALSALNAELENDPGRRERWRKRLRLAELEQLVEADKTDIDVRDLESIRRLLLFTETPPNERLLLRARDAVATWTENEDDRQDEALRDEAAEAVGDLYRAFTPTPRRLWDPILGINAMLDELREDADKEKVRGLLSRLKVEADHLDRSRFADVRRALGRWASDVKEPVTDPLAVKARQSKQSFRPVDAMRADQALNILRERLRQLNEYLRRDEDWKRVGWEEYLQLDKLQREIGQPSDARLSALNDALRLFDSGALGLQRPAFRNTRDALKEYAELLRMTEGTASRVGQSRQALRTALDMLNRFLAGGGPRKESGWKEFLQWDALMAELAEPNPDVRELRRRYLQRFESDEPGLETLPFRFASRRLGKYIELRLMERSTVQPIDIYDDKLDKLARYLEAHSKTPSALTASDISLQTQWLTSMGLATDLVRQIQNRYSHDNVFGSVSARLVREGIQDVITDQTPINRMLDGVQISGTALTNAQVQGQLVPSPNSVILDIILNGLTNTSTIGRRRRVSVYATGVTSLSGRKRLTFDLDNGIQSSPATASANTDQRINGVHVNRRMGRNFITRVAARKAWEAVPKAETMADREARQMITRRMDEEADRMLQDANRQYRDRIQSPLLEQGFGPEMFQVSSTSSHVDLRARLTPNEFFGAPVRPPVWNRNHDVGVCLHESALNNSLAGFLGGVRIDNENILEILNRYDLEVPDELQAKAEEEVWSMTFDSHHPISISIGDNRIHVRAMGMAFEQQDTKVNERIRIGASYQVHWKPRQFPELERDGEVEVEFIDSPGSLSTRQITTKTFMLRKLGSLFKDRIDLSEIETGEFTETLQAVTLRRASLYRGWFAAALDVDVDALPKR